MKKTRPFLSRPWLRAAVLGLGLVTGCSHTAASTSATRSPDTRTRARAYLEENLGALEVTLTPEDLARIDAALPAAAGTRYAAPQMAARNL